MNQEDQPLTDTFYQNPLEYMQNHVRNLNNELFLSEYHINNLYALLLIGRTSPWDSIRGNNPRIKEDIDLIVNLKVQNVKEILQSLSNAYEDKSKKTAISQIEKLMGILKSKKKSIFIEKDKNSGSFKHFEVLTKMAQQLEKDDKSNMNKQQNHSTRNHEGSISQHKQEDKSEPQIQHLAEKQFEQSSQEQQIKKQIEVPTQRVTQQQTLQKKQMPAQQHIHSQEEHNHQHGHICEHHRQKKTQPSDNLVNRGKGLLNKQVFSIFYGLSNMTNLTAMALTNIIEYNPVDRFIKFKMSQTYNMTIKSDDPLHFDTVSQLRKIPPELYTNHIFPYLTASELFKCRSVCKEWLDHVKQSWHSTFKREMFVQLLACEFCKDIEFFYKLIQLRNPFFQKLSLLIHALIQIISWDVIANNIANNSINLQMKRVLIILLRLMGEQLPFTTLNSITDAFFQQHKGKLVNLKQKISQFFSTLSGSDLSINQLRVIKTHFLDDHFMRVEQVNADDKTPLLLNLLVKQITLQQILRNHIYLAQEYLLNTKKRLDNISSKMVYQKGYLEGVYKMLLLKSSDSLSGDSEPNELPNFNQMLQSIFTNRNSHKPDFVLRNRNSSTQIYLDSATKLDIILSTIGNMNERVQRHTQPQKEEQSQIKNQRNSKEEDIVFINEYENGEAKVSKLNQLKKEKNQIVNEINLKIITKAEGETQTKEEQLQQKK